MQLLLHRMFSTLPLPLLLYTILYYTTLLIFALLKCKFSELIQYVSGGESQYNWQTVDLDPLLGQIMGRVKLQYTFLERKQLKVYNLLLTAVMLKKKAVALVCRAEVGFWSVKNTSIGCHLQTALAGFCPGGTWEGWWLRPPGPRWWRFRCWCGTAGWSSERWRLLGYQKHTERSWDHRKLLPNYKVGLTVLSLF